ncbi:[weak similarity to] Zeta toxin, partial [methanotrophic bacterial endosymbiont of Bathymodiolus sp.]
VSKQLWLLAGGNGAGKSTFYRTRLKKLGIPFVNADVIAKEIFPDATEKNSYLAAKITAEIRNKLLQEGRNFCFETVFSHPSKIDFVAHAKALGYQIILVFIHLEPTALNKARVKQRTEEGGHTVPEDKIENRIPRLLEYIKIVLPLCDQVRALDNSSATNPFVPVFTLYNGVDQKIMTHLSPLPEWANKLLTH